MAERTKAEAARDYFLQGYNCAQAVAAAFAPDMGLDEKTVLRLSSGFGGGMGGMREVCGAVSGMFLVYGALRGYDQPDVPQAKKELYAKLQAMADEMKDRYGTLVCRELLRQSKVCPASTPSDRTPEYYQKRPCTRYVEACAEILQEALQEGKALPEV